MVKKFLLLVLVSLFSAVVQAAGALAIDENQGDQYGFAYDYPSIAEASDRALAECGGNCSVVQVFESGCAAYAADQAAGSTIYGWATSSDGSDAQYQALQYCASYGGTECIVRSWGCNSN